MKGYRSYFFYVFVLVSIHIITSPPVFGQSVPSTPIRVDSDKVADILQRIASHARVGFKDLSVGPCDDYGFMDCKSSIIIPGAVSTEIIIDKDSPTEVWGTLYEGNNSELATAIFDEYMGILKQSFLPPNSRKTSRMRDENTYFDIVIPDEVFITLHRRWDKAESRWDVGITIRHGA